MKARHSAIVGVCLGLALLSPAHAASGDLCDALNSIARGGPGGLVAVRTGLIAVVPPPDLSRQSGLAQLFGPRYTETRFGSSLRLPGAFNCFEIFRQEPSSPDKQILRCLWLVGYDNGPAVVREVLTSIGTCWPRPRRSWSYNNGAGMTDGRIYVVRSGLDIEMSYRRGEGSATIDITPTP